MCWEVGGDFTIQLLLCISDDLYIARGFFHYGSPYSDLPKDFSLFFISLAKKQYTFLNLQKQALCPCVWVWPHQKQHAMKQRAHIYDCWEMERLSQAELRAKPLLLYSNSSPLKILPKSLEVCCSITYFGNSIDIFSGVEKVFEAACNCEKVPSTGQQVHWLQLAETEKEP